jgi:phosphoserine phosphatase RsbU/P
MAHRRMNSLRSLYEILTRDLTWDGLNKDLNEDMRGMYEFYACCMKSVEGERNKVKRAVKFGVNFLVAFLLKLTPARRFLYAIGVIFIIVAVSQSKIGSAIYSFIIVSILLAMELADKLITKDELSIARDIQLSLQPSSDLIIPGFELAAHSEAAKQVGGDYFDVLNLSDGGTLIVVGDVSGKGISSALYVVKMQTALQLFATETSDPKELLIRLNSYIYGQLKRNYFLSLFLVKLHSSGNVELCRAGHPPALFYNSATKEVSWLKPNGIAVGMAPSSHKYDDKGLNISVEFSSSIETQSAKFDDGNVLFLFTDGVSESVDKNGGEFGLDRIAELISNNADEPIADLRRHIIENLVQHRNGTDMRDDTTFVLLRRKQSA